MTVQPGQIFSSPCSERRFRASMRTLSDAAFTVALGLSLFALAGCHSKNRLPAAGTKGYAEYASSFYMGLAGLQVGDDVRAESSLSTATTLVPAEPAGWADWGILAFRQRNFDLATQRLQRALSLDQQDDRIKYLLGLVDSARGDSASAISDFQKAVSANPRNLRALYRLAGEVERQGGPDSDAQVQKLIEQLLKAQPDNLAALVDLCRIAAKRGDSATLHYAIGRLAQPSKNWPAEARDQFDQVQTAAASPTPRFAATRSTFLRNVLMRQSEFRDSLSEIAAAPGEEAEPITQFLRMENLPSVPSPPDTAMQFHNESIPNAPGNEAESWNWLGAIALNGDDPPVIAKANGRHVVLASGADLPFPGDTSTKAPTPESVLALDYNYDFKTDVVLAGAGGLRLFRQDSPAKFTDVTSSMNLPSAITSAAYTGAWAIDVEADGDLDIVLGTEHAAASVLRNNADGTFSVIHPFADVSGIHQFAWADLNGDGNPDAAFIDGEGKLRIFLNQRSGRFEEAKLVGENIEALGIAIADTGRDGFLRLHVLRKDGTVAAVSWQQKTATWAFVTIAQLPPPTTEVRLRATDIDDNGAVDLLIVKVAGADSTGGATVLLQDGSGAFHAMEKQQGPSLAFDAADVHGDGRMDLLGVTADGQAMDARNVGTKQYRWQTIRPRARQATGDQRINPFGIGGEIEIRSGLLLQKQPIESPVLHFGLGDRQTVDVARIIWPNGTLRAEFNLKSNQQIVTEQRLKGSCPFLFAWNGTRMEFVKDSVPWGSAIGLRINSLGTAKISATEEWYKIPAEQLRPRDGYYDLRITGELWETYYYDSIALMTVDHPAGTEIFTDERFDVPPVKLVVTTVDEPKPIEHAVDDQGTDVTETLRRLDGKYLDTFGRGPYQGFTRDHFVEIDLGDRTSSETPLWLIAKGWLHPSDSTVNVAMGQGAHDRPRWLSLEVPDGRGSWRVARPNLGFPAGRNKICLIDLTGVFIPGTPHRLRLRTNLEIYWDSIEWAKGMPATNLKIERLQPSLADLHYRGFSAVSQANASSPEIPSYQQLASTAPQWRDLSGFYTRFGDVKELLWATDDRYVVMNAGDEMSLRFAVPPPPPTGWIRDYVIAGDGWIKDGDYNSAESRSVMPYPYHARKDYDAPPGRLEDDWEYQHHREDWQTYQTRYVDADAFRDALKGLAAIRTTP